MKRIIIAIIVLGGVASGGYYLSQKQSIVSYVAPQVIRETVEVEKEVPTTEVRIQAAQDAAQAEIESKAQAAYDETYKHEMDKIEASVLKEIEDELKARRLEKEEEISAYWKDEDRLHRLVRLAAKEYGVHLGTMEAVIECESQWNPTIQSWHTYTVDNVPPGYSVGSREQSFGLVQIHLPAHPNISYSQATDPEFAVEFLAQNMAAGKQQMWSCYKHITMR